MVRPLPFAAALLISASCSCAASSDDAEGVRLYGQVQEIVKTSCALETCHGFMVANAHLELMQNDLRAAWIDVPACEYSLMKRVKPGAPDESWVMVKLAGPVHFEQYANFIDFKPDPSWTPGLPECAGGAFDDGYTWFGTRMPPEGTSSIAVADVETIRAWIKAGAPVD
jgi:hypothetical protein